MYWLLATRRPVQFVELGVHLGFSYFVACQTVKANSLSTKCTGIDTWVGDDHSGPYGPEVFAAVTEWNRRHYAEFSTLVRSTFDDAVDSFPPTSIDVLHIDGRHGYDDVKHDFDTWRGKLFPGATVLFHDTAVDNFGVKTFWNELRRDFPTFEIPLSHGLGVLTYR